MNSSALTWTQWNQTYTTASTSASNAIIEIVHTTDGGTAPMTRTTSYKIWSAWNRHYTLTTSSTDPWGCSASTTFQIDPWVAWNRTYAATPSIADGMTVRRVETPEEEAAARELRRIADRERSIQIEGERKMARDRAQRILQENLTDAQREELAQKGYFSLEVYEGDQRRRYRINRGRSRNVQQVDDNGRVLKTLCAHPLIACPDEDTMLAQMLMIKNQEQQFLRIANHS